jgi:hypothetical protein
MQTNGRNFINKVIYELFFRISPVSFGVGHETSCTREWNCMVKHVHRQIRVERKKLNNMSSVSIIKFNTFSLHDLVFDFKIVAFFLSFLKLFNFTF